MANNRMWLVHVPTGLAVCLGKRMAVGWYPPSTDWRETELQTLFDEVEVHAEPDAFALAMEDFDGAGLALGNWTYSGEVRDDGLTRLRFGLALWNRERFTAAEEVDAVLKLADDYAASVVGHASITDRLDGDELREKLKELGHDAREALRRALLPHKPENEG